VAIRHNRHGNRPFQAGDDQDWSRPTYSVTSTEPDHDQPLMDGHYVDRCQTKRGQDADEHDRPQQNTGRG
jgi:hypothetical protein